jgi:hypothetical protein
LTFYLLYSFLMSLYTFLYKGQVYDTVTVDNVASASNVSELAVG